MFKKILIVIFFLLIIIGGLLWIYQNHIQVEKNKLSPSKFYNQYFILLSDDGKSGEEIGCGDSIIAVKKEQTFEKDLVKNALNDLFSVKEKDIDGGKYYNSLYDANLKFVEIKEEENNIDVYLEGEYEFKGVCEDARFIAQIEKIIGQFAGEKEVEIFLNEGSLKEIYN